MTEERERFAAPVEGKSILVTGGTGSFGRAFTKEVFFRYPALKRLVIFSRDEFKQFEMAQVVPEHLRGRVRFFLGDVRDKDRLRRALEGIDIVVHAAALKQVPAAEYDPFEFIKTNVLGAQNLVESCLDQGVSRVVALSTDKAAAPINLYGATKLCSDKLFVAANNIRGARDLRFSVVRYGNVFGSRGSVVPYFLSRAKTGVIPITDPSMTRFSITLSEGVSAVFFAIETALGGETFIPKIPSYRVLDLADAISATCRKIIIGIRPGEKLHEEMITKHDSLNTIDIGNYFVLLPSANNELASYYLSRGNASRVAAEFSYSSGDNCRFLTISELRSLIGDSK